MHTCDCDIARKSEANPNIGSNLKKCYVQLYNFQYTDNADGHHHELTIFVSSRPLKINITHRVSSIFQRQVNNVDTGLWRRSVQFAPPAATDA